MLFHGRFPSEKAAALFTAKNAEAFALQGIRVKLLIPRRRTGTEVDPFAFYGTQRNVSIHSLPAIDLFGLHLFPSLAFYINLLTFSISCFFYIRKQTTPEIIIYSNETLPLYAASLVRTRVFFEAHELPRKKLWFFHRFVKRLHGIITNNGWKREQFAKLFAIAPNRVLTELNAVDLRTFANTITMSDARAALNLPSTSKIVLYTGHLYAWKGVDTLAEATEHLPDSVQLYFIGGTPEDVAAFRARHKHRPRVHIIGHRPHQEIPLWQQAADILVAPNTAKEAISKYDTSPMKIYEYMASKKPIVTTDLPSIREILDESSAYLVSPDSAKALAEGIKRALESTAVTNERVERAFERVSHHSWEQRAMRILSFIRTTTSNGTAS